MCELCIQFNARERLSIFLTYCSLYGYNHYEVSFFAGMSETTAEVRRAAVLAALAARQSGPGLYCRVLVCSFRMEVIQLFSQK